MMSSFIKIISLYNPFHFWANLCPTSLASLVVEVRTRHSHQILLVRQSSFNLNFGPKQPLTICLPMKSNTNTLVNMSQSSRLKISIHQQIASLLKYLLDDDFRYISISMWFESRVITRIIMALHVKVSASPKQWGELGSTPLFGGGQWHNHFSCDQAALWTIIIEGQTWPRVKILHEVTALHLHEVGTLITEGHLRHLASL